MRRGPHSRGSAARRPSDSGATRHVATRSPARVSDSASDPLTENGLCRSDHHRGGPLVGEALAGQAPPGPEVERERDDGTELPPHGIRRGEPRPETMASLAAGYGAEVDLQSVHGLVAAHGLAFPQWPARDFLPPSG